MSGLAKLGDLWGTIQNWLFPMLEDELGELNDLHREFIAICEICAPRQHLAAYRWVGNGCPPKDRLAMFKAFVAKAVLDLPTTRILINTIRTCPTLRRLCGFETLGDVPSEATFSRAFDAFAQDGLPQTIHQAMIKVHYADKLVGHISRDATAIHARETAVKKEAKLVAQGALDQGQSLPDLTRLQRQLERTLDENVADLPQACDWGTKKKDGKGKRHVWRGYKLNLDVIDGDVPLSWILTSASMHDSQAAIPLAQMSAARVTSLYDLADSAYDATAIRQMSERLGHVAIIDHNPRRGEKKEFDPAQAIRHHQRSSSERVNSHPHDSHGGRHVRVRGVVKVAAHLSFGLLVIAAEQLFAMLC